MSGVVPASTGSSTIFSSCASQPKTRKPRVFISGLSSVVDYPLGRLSLPNPPLRFRGLRGRESVQRSAFRCNCSSNRPGAADSGENESRTVLDAFFLGKALAEVLNERIESTVGEVLGTIGRFQSEQQKQVQEIQEEVLERAKRTKEKAAREAMEEAQGLVPKTTTVYSASVTNNVTSATPSSINDKINQANPSSLSDGVEKNPGTSNEDSLLGGP